MWKLDGSFVLVMYALATLVMITSSITGRIAASENPLSEPSKCGCHCVLLLLCLALAISSNSMNVKLRLVASGSPLREPSKCGSRWQMWSSARRPSLLKIWNSGNLAGNLADKHDINANTDRNTNTAGPSLQRIWRSGILFLGFKELFRTQHTDDSFRNH